MILRERDIAQLLAEREGGQCEVRTPAGSIDVLTARYVYEVKVARQWKAALGQVLAYSRGYPERKPRLYLYGDPGSMTKQAIEEHCRAAGVGVVWHRDEDAPPRERRPSAPPPDSLTLQLNVRDASYGIRSATKIALRTPPAAVPLPTLEAYADTALAVFDALLDNDVTLTLTAICDGATQVVERQRAAIVGNPVCYQLRLTLGTAQPLMHFSVSLAGVRKRVLANYPMGDTVYRMNHAQRDLPELHQLRALILHPEFPWTSRQGAVATHLERALYRNYGITQGNDGPKIGGR
jgi:hypothetical protein